MNDEMKSMNAFGDGVKSIPADLVLVLLGAPTKKKEIAHAILSMYSEFRVVSESDLEHIIQQVSPSGKSARQNLSAKYVFAIKQIIQRQQRRMIPTIICLDFYLDLSDLARGTDFNNHVLFVNLYDSMLGSINIDVGRETWSQMAGDIQKEINKCLS